MNITPMRVQMEFTTFGWRLGSPLEDPGGQVYLWAAFFKLDGDTISLDSNGNLQGTATVTSTPGNQGDLGANDFSLSNSVLEIPPNIGRYATLLKGIPVYGILMPALVGAVAIAMQDRGSPASAIAAGHNALNTSIQQQLNKLIPTFGISNQPNPTTLLNDVQALTNSVSSAVKQAVQNALSLGDLLLTGLGFDNQDQAVMNAVFLGAQGGPSPSTGTFVNFANVPTGGTALQQQLKNTSGWEHTKSGKLIADAPVVDTYTVNGVAKAEPFPLSLRRLLTDLGDPPPVNMNTLLHGSVQDWIDTV